MTAEKHPLELVRDVLEFYASGTFALVHENRFLEWGESNVEITSTNVIGHRASEALTTLNHYLCQPQSCAECERLGMENDAMKSTLIAMRELNKRGLVEENKALREAVRDFGAVCGGVDDWGDKLAAVQEKHAATIAAAGGE